MKLNKFNQIAKNVIAATALTVASFGANAGAVAVSELEIDKLFFQFTNISGVASSSAVTFSGSEATASVNGVGSQHSWATGDTINPNIDPLLLSKSTGSGSDITGTGAFGLVNLSGDLQLGTSKGITNSSASAHGYSSALGTSVVENTFDSAFTILNGANPIFLDINFDWDVSLLSQITDNKFGQTASSEYNFSIEIIGEDSGDFFEIDLRDIIGGSAKRTQKTDGIKTLVNSGSTSAGDFKFELNAGESYGVTILQGTRSNAVSVTEPASIALFGLSLLGLAGAARRRQS